MGWVDGGDWFSGLTCRCDGLGGLTRLSSVGSFAFVLSAIGIGRFWIGLYCRLRL